MLAAGAGSRFGTGPKQLAELGGRPLLEHAIRAQTDVAELERVVVVLGSHAGEVLERVDFGRAEPVVCERWQEGLSASLRHGVAVLKGAEHVLVTLGDQPLVNAAVIRRFLEAPGGSRATYGGEPGHPVVLGPLQLQLLHTMAGDKGAQELLAGGERIECSDICSGRDVDTRADLDAVRRFAG